MDALEAPRTVLRVTARLYQRISAQIILLTAFLGLSYFLLYFLLNSSLALGIFDQVVNSQLRGRIVWTRLNWGPLPWKLDVHEPALIDPDGEPVITVDRIRLSNIRLSALLDSQIAIDGIEIIRPRVYLKARPHPEGVDDLGRPGNLTNIAAVFLPPEGEVVLDEGDPGSPMRLAFTDVNIRGATFVLDQPEILIRTVGANVNDARFAMDSADAQTSMTINAASVEFTRTRVSIPGADLATPVAKAAASDLMTWTLSDGIIRHFDWREQAFTVSALEGSLRGDPIEVRGIAMDLDQPGVPTLVSRVHFRSDSLARHLLPLGIEGVDGAVDLRARSKGQLDSIDATITAEGDWLEVMGNRLSGWTLQAGLDPEGVARLDALEAGVADGRVYARGIYDIQRADAAVNAQLYDIDPAKIPDIQAIPEVRRLARGPMDLRVRVHGVALTDAAARTASVTVDMDHRRVGASGIPGLPPSTELNVIAALNGDRLKVHRLHLDAGPNQLRVEGTLGVSDQRGDLTGRFTVPDLAPIGAAMALPIDGSIDASFNINGALTDPVAEVRLSGRQLRYADYPTADLLLQARYAKQIVTLADVDVRTDAGSVSAAGTIGLRGRPSADVTVNLSNVDVSAFPIDVDIAGQLETARAVRITGPLTAPSIDGAIRIKGPRFERLGLSDIVVDGAFAGNTVSLRALRVTGPGGMQLTADGSVSLARKTFVGTLKGDKIPIDMANAFVDEPLGVRGRIGFELAGEGPFSNPSGKGVLTVSALGFQGYDLADSRLDMVAADGKVDIQGRLFELLVIEGTVPMRPEAGMATAQLAFNELTPKRLGFSDPRFDLTTTGRINARYDIFGPVGLDSLDMTLTTLDASYLQRDLRGNIVRTPMLSGPNDPTLRLEAERPVRISFRHGVGAFDDVALKINGQPLVLVGTVGQDMTLDVALRAALDLGIAAPFANATFNDISGLMHASIDVIGPLDDPNVNGWVRIERLDAVPRSSVIGRDLHLEQPAEFVITTPIGPQPVQPGKSSLGTFTVALADFTRPRPGKPAQPNRFALRRDEALVAVTQVSVEIVQFGLERLYVAADASDMALNVPGVIRAGFDATGLSVEMFQHREGIRGPETRLRIGGDIAVEEAEYIADIVASDALNQGVTDNLRGRSRAQSISVFERVPLLKRMMLDVRVRAEDSVWVRSNLAVVSTELELKMDVRARGFLVGKPSDSVEDQLQIDGTVDILDDASTITYQRRTFDVNEGIVNLGGQNFMSANVVAATTFKLRTDQGQTNTTFDTGAGADLREEEVTLEIEVVMPTRDSDPKINPTLTSSSGASKIEVLTLLLTGRYPSDLTGAASAAPATEVLLGPVLSMIERPLEETLDLNLSLTPDATGTLFIDADKSLSRRLRLYSRTPVGTDSATNPQIFGLEYRINNTIFSELTNEQLGNNNATSGRLRLRLVMD
ncbi:MAG: hypothetical protein ACI9U2_002513 [Bradymonadia bacterium]|jgi:hypothetical protein